MARVTAQSLQVGTEARRLSMGTLGFVSQRRDMAGVLGHGLRERGRIGLGSVRGCRGIQTGGVTLGAEVPGGQRGHGAGRRQADRQRMPAEQREDCCAHQE
ncbi:MAG: hypothetical protein IRZ07_22270 [Microbispora sp.]|nr:hypothetical protein [Microbispora sp.]